MHQKEARANKIGQLRKAEAALTCKTFEVGYEDLKLKAHKPGQQSERLQDDKNSAVVEASGKMLAWELQGKVDGHQAAEESLKTTEAKAEAVEARAAPTEKADCDEQLA